MNPAFLAFLEKTPSALAKIFDVAVEWYKIQGELPEEEPDPDGPAEFHAGGSHALRTTGISTDELNAIAKGYAEGVVKEKAIAYVKGFIAGVSLAS